MCRVSGRADLDTPPLIQPPKLNGCSYPKPLPHFWCFKLCIWALQEVSSIPIQLAARASTFRDRPQARRETWLPGMAQLQMGPDPEPEHLWDAPINKTRLLHSQYHKIHTAIKKSKKLPKQTCLKALYFQVVILTVRKGYSSFSKCADTQISPHSLPCMRTL